MFESDPKLQPNIHDWYEYENKLRRQFTVLCSENQQMFILTLKDLNRMKTEYQEHYDEIFDQKIIRL